MNLIDAGMAVIVVMSAGFGVCKGFFRQIFGIIAMVVSTVAAVLYFKSGGHILAAGGVFLATGVILRIAFLLWQRFVRKDAKLSRVSRAGGGIVGGIIGIVYVVVILMSLSYLVILFPTDSGFARAVAGSGAFAMYNAVTGALKRPAVRGAGSAGVPQGAIIDERWMESLSRNPAIQAALEDKEFIALIEKRNLAAIMAHPLFRKIIEAPKLMKELMDAALKKGAAEG